MAQTKKTTTTTTDVAEKPKKKKKDNTYFGKREEDAVVEYLNEPDHVKRNAIFNEILAPAFYKMVESIIRRYKLFVPDEEFDDTYHDALSSLITKLDKFKPAKNKKAYSYYGTITKRYLIARLEKYATQQQRSPSYDAMDYDFTNSLRYSDTDDGPNLIANKTIDAMIVHIEDMLTSPVEYPLNENEILVGTALKNLLENWDYVLNADKSNKFNTNTIKLFFKEQTNLDSKSIKAAFKIYEEQFPLVKATIID